MPQLPFTFRRQRRGSSSPEASEEAAEGSAAEGPRRWTVTALTQALRRHVETGFGRIWVEGEIRGCRIQPSSGHAYFDLVDRRAKVSVFMAASYVRRLPFPLEDGAHVLLDGEVSVYESRGQLQLRARRLEPVGEGALLVALRASVAKLEREGLTAAERKQSLPRWPGRVGVVTSRSGAAFRDVWRTVVRRDPGVQMLLAPTLVQGLGAVEGIVRALRALDRQGCDVILVVRGGGSLEDLRAFNEEVVARAVAATRAPVVTGVGHETDTTLVDLVADLRASTPTGAAAAAVPVRADLLRSVEHLRLRLDRAVRGRLLRADRDLRALEGRLLSPRPALQEAQQRVDDRQIRLTALVQAQLAEHRRRAQAWLERLESGRPEAATRRRQARLAQLQLRLARVSERLVVAPQARCEGLEAKLEAALRARQSAASAQLEAAQTHLQPALNRRLDQARGRFQSRVAALEALSPLAVLGRGYAVVHSDSGVIRSAAKVRPGQTLKVRVADGQFEAKVIPPDPTKT